jgi:hypothetical protein
VCLAISGHTANPVRELMILLAVYRADQVQAIQPEKS